MWRPSLLQRKNFSILHSQYLKLVSDGKNEEDSSVEPNVEEIIAHMLLTGEGLLIDSKFNN